MGYPYLPLTPPERREMLSAIGVDSIADLFADIPQEISLKTDLNLPPPLSESELVRHVQELADRNISLTDYTSFLGAGVYQHLIPSAVPHLANRAEFVTAYTPYQAEISQGVLQATFEYQTLICQLTDMDVATHLFMTEPQHWRKLALMSIAITGGNQVITFESLHPDYRAVVETYLPGCRCRTSCGPHKTGLGGHRCIAATFGQGNCRGLAAATELLWFTRASGRDKCLARRYAHLICCLCQSHILRSVETTGSLRS